MSGGLVLLKHLCSELIPNIILKLTIFWTLYNIPNTDTYLVTRKKVYLFLRFLYPNRMIIKLKVFYIDEFVLMNTAWIRLRFV